MKEGNVSRQILMEMVELELDVHRARCTANHAFSVLALSSAAEEMGQQLLFFDHIVIDIILLTIIKPQLFLLISLSAIH